MLTIWADKIRFFRSGDSLLWTSREHRFVPVAHSSVQFFLKSATDTAPRPVCLGV